jgi:hypothetical protein
VPVMCQGGCVHGATSCAPGRSNGSRGRREVRGRVVCGGGARERCARKSRCAWQGVKTSPKWRDCRWDTVLRGLGCETATLIGVRESVGAGPRRRVEPGEPVMSWRGGLSRGVCLLGARTVVTGDAGAVREWPNNANIGSVRPEGGPGIERRCVRWGARSKMRRDRWRVAPKGPDAQPTLCAGRSRLCAACGATLQSRESVGGVDRFRVSCLPRRSTRVGASAVVAWTGDATGAAWVTGGRWERSSRAGALLCRRRALARRSRESGVSSLLDTFLHGGWPEADAHHAQAGAPNLGLRQRRTWNVAMRGASSATVAGACCPRLPEAWGRSWCMLRSEWDGGVRW